MNETIKEKAFYEAQKYIATQAWIDIRTELERDIQSIEDFIQEDAHLPQPLENSRNMMRGKWIILVQSFIERINNPHLQKVLRFVILDDNKSRLLIPTEVSEDIISYSDKDWCRRKRRILQYIANFDKIYWQQEEKDNNESVEVWMNSLAEGISL